MKGERWKYSSWYRPHINHRNKKKKKQEMKKKKRKKKLSYNMLYKAAQNMVLQLHRQRIKTLTHTNSVCCLSGTQSQSTL